MNSCFFQIRTPRGHALPQRLIVGAIGTGILALSLFTPAAFVPVALAGDPFRTTNPAAIGPQTEAAFRAIFERGDYRSAETQLQQALIQEPDEPLIYALRASLAYSNWQAADQETTRAQALTEIKNYAKKTREAGDRLIAQNPLRGHLYVAVGHFLEGAYLIAKEGAVSGAPRALGQLQWVIRALDAAEKINANDPELNLIRGYMDLMLAVNLPFTNPDRAISRLQEKAAPVYLVQRGLALGYRDMGKSDQAMEAVNRALELTPDNPDLFYLKAQILRLQSNYAESLIWFQKALDKQEQLLPAPARQIAYEQCRTEQQMTGESLNCRSRLTAS
ncbi:Sll0314/Alr1548 family TPR repeat-containing protein [Trichothermofontia sp.]